MDEKDGPVLWRHVENICKRNDRIEESR